MAWYNTVEFYIISGAVAAAVVALSALPAKQTPAVLHMAAGELSAEDPDAEPSLQMEVDRDGRLHITRRGLRGICSDGAVSLAANAIGFDIKIEERLTPGGYGTPVDTARFTFDFFGPERYHFSYNSEDSGLFAAFTIPIREGLRLTRKLS